MKGMAAGRTHQAEMLLATKAVRPNAKATLLP